MSLEFKKITGGIYHWNSASIGEIEVIDSPISLDRFKEIVDCRGIVYGEYKVDTCGRCLHPDDPMFNHCLTLIESKKYSNDILVYPNPVLEVLHLKWNPFEKSKEYVLPIYKEMKSNKLRYYQMINFIRRMLGIGQVEIIEFLFILIATEPIMLKLLKHK